MHGLKLILSLLCILVTPSLAASIKQKDPHNLSTICGKDYELSPQGLRLVEKVHGLSGNGAVRRVNSAQHQALCWMVLEDKFKLK